MSSDECIHLMDPAHCTLCNGKEAARRRDAQSIAYVFEAHYESHCQTCGEPVAIGDSMFRMVDGSLRCDQCKVNAAR